MSRATRRLHLQQSLEDILESRNVYFQPPASISISYPCIIYTYDDESKMYANGKCYLERDKYTVLLITKDPMPDIIMSKLELLPYVRFDRHYVSDNLHHFAYTLTLLERTQNV